MFCRLVLVLTGGWGSSDLVRMIVFVIFMEAGFLGGAHFCDQFFLDIAKWVIGSIWHWDAGHRSVFAW